MTSSGAFGLTDPCADEVNFTAIAQALSQLNRFTGHTRVPYTVAQHSVLVALWLAQQGATLREVQGGLLHDAHEAYVGDIASPIKAELARRCGQKVVHDLEHSIQSVVAAGLGVCVTDLTRDTVVSADLMALLCERDRLLPLDAHPWPAETLVPYAREKHNFPWHGVWSHRFARFAFVYLAKALGIPGAQRCEQPDRWNPVYRLRMRLIWRTADRAGLQAVCGGEAFQGY